MVIKILGSGCANCKRLESNVRKAVEDSKIDVVIEKVTDMGLIIGYGVMSTPALVVDEVVVSYGVIPTVVDITDMILKKDNSAPESPAKKSCSGCSCGRKC